MTPAPIPEWFVKWAIEQANKGGYPNNHPISTYIAAASAAYRLLSSQGLRWVSVDERKPDTVGDTDWSLNVLAICDGKLMVMSYGYIDGEGEESGWEIVKKFKLSEKLGLESITPQNNDHGPKR